MRLHGEAAAGGDFADRQIGLAQQAADFLQLAAADCLRDAFALDFLEANLQIAARDFERGGKRRWNQAFRRRRQSLAGVCVDELFGGGRCERSGA